MIIYLFVVYKLNSIIINKKYPILYDAVQKAKKKNLNMPPLPSIKEIDNSFRAKNSFIQLIIGWEGALISNELTKKPFNDLYYIYLISNIIMPLILLAIIINRGISFDSLI